MLDRMQIKTLLRLAYARGLGAEVTALLLDVCRGLADDAEAFVYGCELVLDVLHEVESEGPAPDLSDKSD